MIQFQNTEKGRYKTVPVTQLDQYTGWRLVALVPLLTARPEESWTNGRQEWQTRTHESVQAIIFEDEGSALSKLQQQLEAATKSERAEAQARYAAHRELEQEKRKVAEFEANRNAQAERIVAYIKSVEELNASKRKLEVDLGKLRAHFGEKVFNEVVGR